MADYVPYGSRCKCSKGSMENYLSTEKGHGVIFLGNPLMNANDHVVGVNITHFGDCSSRKLKSFKFPKKCEPLLPTPWEEVKKTYLIEGAPALTMDSVLTCYYGGIITLVPPPPPEEDLVGEEENIEKDDKELEQKNKQKFLDSLPPELSSIISIDNLVATDDGYVMCNKSLDAILLGLGKEIKLDKNKNMIESYYDDWYLTGLVSEGNTIYSLNKIREINDNQQSHGVSVPFVALNINELKKLDGDDLYNTLFKVTNGAGDSSEHLLNYFTNPHSKASYLLADQTVAKALSQASDNKLYLKNIYNEFDKWGKTALDNSIKTGTYNINENYISIKNPSKLTSEEYSLLLLASTGNTDTHSFAGEVLWHAQMQQTADTYQSLLTMNNGDPTNGIIAAIGTQIEKHSIISDSGVGESSKYKIWDYEKLFKSKDSDIYQEQIKIHGMER